MTLLSQFAESVIGSTLPRQFRRTRLSLTLLIFLALSVLLLVSGINAYEQTRAGFEAHRVPPNAIIITPGNDRGAPNNAAIRIQREKILDKEREDFLRQTRNHILVTNAALVLLLTGISWLSLFFLLKPLAQSLREREIFLENASHELRTPLAILHSNLSLSEHETDVFELKKTQKEALFEIKRLQNLSDTLLNRLQQNVVLSRSSLRVLFDRVWKKMPQTTMRLQNKIPSGMKILTDTLQCEQLVFNILDNAVTHGVSGAVVHVELGENQAVRVSNPITPDITECTHGIGMRVQDTIAGQLGVSLERQISQGVFEIIISGFRTETTKKPRD